MAIVLRVRRPVVLEGMMIAFIGVGMVMRMWLMTVQPTLSFLWPTLIIGLVFIIYIYLPVRFLLAAAISTVFSVVASAWWLLIAETGLPLDQMLRAMVWLAFANALGFIAANSSQRGQRMRYAQSLLLRELLSTDAMTGIGNRRRFDDALDREWRRCSRSGKPLSLLMIDVDHFKAYNDHHGHLQGDECLRNVAQLLVESVGRPADLVARYGGEEFVCLLPEIGEEGARAVAAKFMMGVARASIPHAALPADARLTISIGAATCNEVSRQTPGALVALADKLLYDAKRAGRDRVMTGLL
jgi:diguanylate cyclase (GGDEF)-like protein